MRVIICIILLGVIMPLGPGPRGQDTAPEELPPIHSLWDYFDPAGSRQRFEEIKAQAQASGDTEYYLSLLTQIARTYGLESQFNSAHAVLDIVEKQLGDNLPVAKVNYLLERGRAFRSAGETKKSRPLFKHAFTLADSTGQSYLAIDAAHMMALAVEDPEQRMQWNQRGLELAKTSDDPRAINWVGSISNNIGWDYHDRGQYDSAMTAFQTALAAREKQGDPQRLRVAKWCVARCLRSLNKLEKALEMQTALLEENRQQGTTDGYVFEELGELYILRQDSVLATVFFQHAYDALSQDQWFVNNESERLARIKQLAGIN